jgi:hypothetical protein
MRKYIGTNEPCTGDIVRLTDPDAEIQHGFDDAIVEGIEEDGTVHLCRPHMSSDGGGMWGTSLHTERFDVTLARLVDHFWVHTRDQANQNVDNRNRYPERIPAGRR